MNEWSQEPLYFDKDIQKLRLEPWKSLEEFENQLKYEEKGYQIELINHKKRCSFKIEQLKNMAGDRIDALERAIVTQKLKYNKIVENLTMQICEYESRQMNTVMSENQIQNIMKSAETNKKVTNVFEAKELINNLKMAFQSKVNEF